MTFADTPKGARIAWRAAEILEAKAGTPLSCDDLTDLILREDKLDGDKGDIKSAYQQIVSEVMAGSRIVDLRRAGHFPV